jgi:tetratricopeptide (TPR) repeat protein
LISDWPRLQVWLRERKEAEVTRRRLEEKAKEWVRLGSSEGGMLDKEELTEVDDWLAGQGENGLDASTDLLDLVSASRKAINPGWSRQGVAALFIGAVSLAALAAWVYVTIETSSLRGVNRAATIIFFIGIAVFIGLVGWKLLRSGSYALQRLSYDIASRRSKQVALLLVAMTTVLLWIMSGVNDLMLTMECARMGIDWTSDTLGIGIVSEDADPKAIEVYRLTLQNAIAGQKSMVISVDDSVARKCSALFRHRITIAATQDSDQQEGIFVASLASGSNEIDSLATVGEGCGEVVALAHKTAFALGYVDTPVANCQISGPVACEPWLLNEEAYALYRQSQFKEAEARFDALVKRYPDFAWAIHNLGMTKSANCQDPANAVSHLQTAVALTNENCGWFLYDLALVCRAAGDHICASEAAAQVIKIEPSFEDAYNALSVIYRESGRLDEAANMLNEYALRVGNTDQARWDQMTALEKNQGILAFEQGRYADALDLLRKAERRMKQVNFVRRAASDQPLPYEEEIVFYLGRVNEELGNAAAACSYWQRHARLPQNCLFGETERRRYALDQLRAQMCER